jgi:uncharacterized protein (DUF4213/DUF364 family)
MNHVTKNRYQEVYPLLLDSLDSTCAIEEVIMGLTWTYCRSEGAGLAMGPEQANRMLPWSGSLRGRSLNEVAQWITSWNPIEAAVAMAAINSSINHHNPLLAQAKAIAPQSVPANLSVFEHFLPQLQGKKVAVVGRYPGLDRYQTCCDMTVLERHTIAGDVPDQACEYVLPESEWVFMTASTLTNKTFPRLAELAKDSQLVLMGPTVPWLSELVDFGVDYLAGVAVCDEDRLKQTVAEGGGTRIFETGVEYRVMDLREVEMQWQRLAIEDLVARREQLKLAMDQWYDQNSFNVRYPRWQELAKIDDELSMLDNRFKLLWDDRNCNNPLPFCLQGMHT